MAIACSNISTRALSFSTPNYHFSSPAFPVITRRITPTTKLPTSLHVYIPTQSRHPASFVVFSGGNGTGNIHGGGGGRGGGGGGGDGDGAGDKNKGEAILALAELGRSLDSVPRDLAAAIEDGRIPGSIVKRYFELEKSAVFRWLLQFGGFKERLLADDLFLTKVGIECGVGIFTKVCCSLIQASPFFDSWLSIVCPVSL